LQTHSDCEAVLVCCSTPFQIVSSRASNATEMPETENPWENAASDPSWNQANFSMEEKADAEDTMEHDPVDGDLTGRIARCIINSWHFADSAIGFVMLVYGIVLRTEGKEPKVLEWSVLSLGAVLLIRATVGTWSVYREVFGRMGILLSAYCSTILSFVLFVASMTALG
jgi:heme A synthase